MHRNALSYISRRVTKCIDTPLVVTAMTLDFAQYLYQALAWRIYLRTLEKVHGSKSDKDFAHPPWIPFVAEVIFVSKVVLVFVAYVLLAEYLFRRVF
jgi:hypothetical protein